MSQQEVIRAQVMELLTAGKIFQKEAGKMLDVSVRQIKRIVKRYRAAGLQGLLSKKRGIPSNQRMTETTRQLAVEAIGAHYRDFGPTLASEKLLERHNAPALSLCRNKGDSEASISSHGRRLLSTASGCRKSIIDSRRLRKKSGVPMAKSLSILLAA